MSHTEAERGKYAKITEPKTPYHHASDFVVPRAVQGEAPRRGDAGMEAGDIPPLDLGMGMMRVEQVESRGSASPSSHFESEWDKEEEEGATSTSFAAMRKAHYTLPKDHKPMLGRSWEEEKEEEEEEEDDDGDAQHHW